MKTIWTGTDERGEIIWNAVFLDFARYWGFRPRLCRPYRAQIELRGPARRPMQENERRLRVQMEQQEEQQPACLADLAGHFTRPGVDFRETLNEMLSHPHDTDGRYQWRTPAGLRTSTHPVVSQKAQEMLDKEDKELSGVVSTAKTALALYSDP